jgi:opacity protein-like surface antigen
MVMPLLGVQVELNYSMQGVNTKVESSSSLLGAASTTKTNYKANYVTIPILAKAHFANIAAYFGPQLGFNAGFNTETTTITGDNTNLTNDTVESYNGFDFSLVFGAQYKLTQNIGVDVRYNLGLTNVFPAITNDKGEVLTEAWGKQGVAQIGVFYEF